MLVELYARRGSAASDEAREVLERVRGAVPFDLIEVDIDLDPKLRAQFDRLKAQNSVVGQAKALANEAFHAFTVQDWRESVRLYSEALETCGDCEIEGTLHRDLGLTLYRDGQIDRGVEELRTALALNPEDRDAAKAMEAIRALNQR